MCIRDSLLTQEDKDAMTLENFKHFYTIPDELADAIELIPEVKESIKVDKFTSSVNGETATVTYFIYLPDLENIGNLSLEDAKTILSMKSHRLKDLPEEIQNKIKESVKKEGVPTRSSVSYTHLDVYKRQLIYTPLIIIRRELSNA